MDGPGRAWPETKKPAGPPEDRDRLWPDRAGRAKDFWLNVHLPTSLFIVAGKETIVLQGRSNHLPKRYHRVRYNVQFDMTGILG